MSVSDPLININGVSLGSGDVNSYKLSYAKLWKDAGRDMSGNLHSTLIGIYPNIDVTTSILDFADAQALSAAINHDFFTVTYWDTQTSSLKSATYYAADHELTLLNECKYGQVEVQLVPVRKADYI